MITIPTISEIKEQILADLEASQTTTPLVLVSVLELLATAYAGVLYLAYKFGAWCYAQIFTATMGKEALKLRAQRYGISVNSATECQAFATATGTDGVVIAAGKLAEIDGNAYAVMDTVVIAGETQVKIKSLLTGENYQLTVGDELKFTTPQIGVNDEICISEIVQNAEDEQTVESLRRQVQQREQNTPQGGAIPDYIGWALEVSGVGEAFVCRPAAGFVNVYVLTDETDPADRLPNAALRRAVGNYINEPGRLPFGNNVVSPEWAERSFQIEFQNFSTGGNSVEVKAAIEQAVVDYIYARRPRQYTNHLIDLSVIAEGQLSKIALENGATNIKPILKNSDGDIIAGGKYQLDNGDDAVELAKISVEDISWT